MALAPHLPGGVSSTLQLIFRFDSVDSVANTGAGFLIDDVEILASTTTCSSEAELWLAPPPLQQLVSWTPSSSQSQIEQML